MSDYARRTAVTTSNYVAIQLERFRNPKMEYISQLIGAFDQNWEPTFRQLVLGAPADSVDSIVNNRNRIAHGENVGISYVTIKDYFRDALTVIELIDERFQ